MNETERKLAEISKSLLSISLKLNEMADYDVISIIGANITLLERLVGRLEEAKSKKS